MDGGGVDENEMDDNGVVVMGRLKVRRTIAGWMEVRRMIVGWMKTQLKHDLANRLVDRATAY